MSDDAVQNVRLDRVESDIKDLQDLNRTLVKNQEDFRESLAVLSTSVNQTNMLLSEGFNGMKKLSVLIMGVLGSLGIGSQIMI